MVGKVGKVHRIYESIFCNNLKETDMSTSFLIAIIGFNGNFKYDGVDRRAVGVLQVQTTQVGQSADVVRYILAFVFLDKDLAQFQLLQADGLRQRRFPQEFVDLEVPKALQ